MFQAGEYQVTSTGDRWIVSVCGKRVLICQNKRTAIATARLAAALMADADSDDEYSDRGCERRLA